MTIQNQWIPETALVIHRSGDNSSFAMTRHEVTTKGMGLGEYVSIEQCVSLLAQRSGKNELAPTLKPQYLLLNTDKGMLWYKPSHNGLLWFRYNNIELQLAVTYPALLFGVNSGNSPRLSVYALEGDTYPALTSKIYNAPLMNVSINGVVCQGTASLPREITPTQQCISQIEETIFNSYFTHVNNDKTIKSDKPVDTSDLVKFWQSKMKTSAPVEIDDLVFKGTVNDIINLLV